MQINSNGKKCGYLAQVISLYAYIVTFHNTAITISLASRRLSNHVSLVGLPSGNATVIHT